MSLRLHAVTLVVPEYDAALQFYCKTLGFHLLEDTDLGAGKRWVLVAPQAEGGTCFLLARAADARQRSAIGEQTGGRVGFFLQTDDFETDHARLRAAGVVFEEAPRHEPYGTVAVMRDPFGNRWDLIEFSPHPAPI